jgi:hypothetical protein
LPKDELRADERQRLLDVLEMVMAQNKQVPMRRAERNTANRLLARGYGHNSYKALKEWLKRERKQRRLKVGLKTR